MLDRTYTTINTHFVNLNLALYNCLKFIVQQGQQHGYSLLQGLSHHSAGPQPQESYEHTFSAIRALPKTGIYQITRPPDNPAHRRPKIKRIELPID